MTQEQKVDWLANASAEELVKQAEWTIAYRNSDNIALRIEGNRDWELVKGELLKRLGK